MHTKCKEVGKFNGKKRKQVKIACVNCRKSKTGCSSFRPCQRCVDLGIADCCVDAPRKSRRKKSKWISNKNDNKVGKAITKKKRGRKVVNIKKNLNLMEELEVIISNHNSERNGGEERRNTKKNQMMENRLPIEEKKSKEGDEEDDCQIEEEDNCQIGEEDNSYSDESAVHFINQIKNDTSYKCELSSASSSSEALEDYLKGLESYFCDNYNNKANNDYTDFLFNDNNTFSSPREDNFYSSSSESSSVCSSPGEDFLSSNLISNEINFNLTAINHQDLGFFLSDIETKDIINEDILLENYQNSMVPI